MSRDDFQALEDLINGVKEASPYFLRTLSYLRRRETCPGTKSFDAGIKIINKSLEIAIRRYQEMAGKK